MIPTNQYTQMTAQHEGTRHQPYKDSRGNWTIGTGHKLDPNKPLPKNWDDSTIQNNYSKDYTDAEDRAARIIGPKYNALSPMHQAILNDMSFQLGNKLSGFHNMINAIQNDKLDEVSGHMLDSDWADQTPNRAQDLADKWDAAITTSPAAGQEAP